MILADARYSESRRLTKGNDMDKTLVKSKKNARNITIVFVAKISLTTLGSVLAVVDFYFKVSKL